MIDLGYNYRMNDIQASLGLSQLTKIDTFIKCRRKIAAFYNFRLSSIPGVIIPEQRYDVQSGWHIYMVQIDSEIISKSRKQIFGEMRAATIGVHVHYIPVYWHPYY